MKQKLMVKVNAKTVTESSKSVWWRGIISCQEAFVKQMSFHPGIIQ